MENEFELEDLSAHVDPEDDPDDSDDSDDSDDPDQETSFINESFEDNFSKEGSGRLHVSESRVQRINRNLNHRNAEDFFTNILDLEPECSQHEFIDYLVDTGVLSIKREFSKSGLIIDYRVKYLGGDFQSIGRALTEEETDLLRDGIRGYHDDWTERKMNKILKKAGIATAIGLSVIALVSGLSIGLTRKGSDIVYQAKKYEKWKKLNPAKKTGTVPWTKLEKATGKVVIFTGEYIVIIITLAGVYFYSK